MVDTLRCPSCGGSVEACKDEQSSRYFMECSGCGRTYGIRWVVDGRAHGIFDSGQAAVDAFLEHVLGSGQDILDYMNSKAKGD